MPSGTITISAFLVLAFDFADGGGNVHMPVLVKDLMRQANT